MNLEVRAFFPEGVSTPKQLREKIIRSHTSFLQKGFGEFSVTDLKMNEFLGRAGFAELKNGEIEVGYLLLKEHWGKGIATEALSALLDWAGKALSVPIYTIAVPKTIKALLCPDQDQQSAVLQTKNPSLAGHDIEVLSQCGLLLYLGE